MKFNWNPAKAAANVRNHGVSFEEAETLFGPAKPAIFDDLRHSAEEDRYIAIGFSSKGRLLLVSFAHPGDELIRLISARRATRQEAELYAEYKNQQD